MAVLPGSLDYLYHYGILDHIPYEAYERTPVMQNMNQGYGTGYNGLNSNPMNYSGIQAGFSPYFQSNSNQYLNMAQQGQLYNTYQEDLFVRNNTYNQPYAQTGANTSGSIKEEKGKNFRETIMNIASETQKTVSNTPDFVKGLLACTVMFGTLICLLRGKK